jgi:hypothetical protein
MTTREETAIWTVVHGVATNTRRERVANLREKGLGLKGVIPTFKDGEVDLLSLWLHLYLGKIEEDLYRLNEEGFRKKEGWKLVTQHEWAVFIGIIYAARQFNQLGKELWTS